MVPDGYGLSYSIGDDYIRWTITSLREDTAELKRCLVKATVDVKNMLSAALLMLKSYDAERGKL